MTLLLLRLPSNSHLQEISIFSLNFSCCNSNDAAPPFLTTLRTRFPLNSHSQEKPCYHSLSSCLHHGFASCKGPIET
ncbi:hypothetical protein ACSBR1_039792 [Camellia fascicularis]